MMSNLERLVYMANQIARNFIALGHDHAVAATADHLASFWDPRMKRQIFACLDDDAVTLDPTARAAVQRWRERGSPPSQTLATMFGAGQDGPSDAG